MTEEAASKLRRLAERVRELVNVKGFQSSDRTEALGRLFEPFITAGVFDRPEYASFNTWCEKQIADAGDDGPWFGIGMEVLDHFGGAPRGDLGREEAERIAHVILGLVGRPPQEPARTDSEGIAGSNSPRPWSDRLSPGAGKLWKWLAGRCMQAKPIADCPEFSTSEQTIRQHVAEIRRRSGNPKAIETRSGWGYYRPDAPPDFSAITPKRQRRIARP